jgi:hypothetical protein
LTILFRARTLKARALPYIKAWGPHPFAVPGILGGTAMAMGAITTYRRLIRPWHVHWGATREEVEAPMPGDQVVPNANYCTTRAITIAAPRREVWPWLVQMGQGRGGFYSFDGLENLIGLRIHSADRIVPELQELRAGDLIPLAPGEAAGYTVREILPERLLLLETHDLGPSVPGAREKGFASTWAFALAEIAEGHTRLVARWRARYTPEMAFGKGGEGASVHLAGGTAAALAMALVLDTAEFVMERGMLKRIKARAERARRHGRPAPETGPPLGFELTARNERAVEDTREEAVRVEAHAYEAPALSDSVAPMTLLTVDYTPPSMIW